MSSRPGRLDGRARELFAAALERPAAERAAYLTEVCAADSALLAQVDALLADLGAAEARFEEIAPPLGEQAGECIGHYKLRQKLGEGGFGVVWMAEQEEPVRRMVALKVLKPGMDTAQVIGRFEAERQALALMDHPNIAKVFDGGATPGGRPYFVMELVKGMPITRYCDGAGLGVRERLELFVPVCQAVQHAHQKGVIHRDLKPSNVLVTLHDGVPVPKVIDFGIAKAARGTLTQRTVFTEFRQMLGTPQYMAPEQASLSALDVDTRADVYSLGILLYELLTGAPPFELETLMQSGYEEMLRTIREVDPPRPSTRVSTQGEGLAEVARLRRVPVRSLGSSLRGDLDWIVMKAIEKERGRRYATAAALAEDVLRHLQDEPVLASPPSRRYRFRKYVQRHRVGVAASLAVALALVAGALAAGWGYVEARRQAEDARDAKTLADEQRSAAELARAEEQRQKEAALAAQASAQREAEKAQQVVLLLGSLLGGSHPSARGGPDYTVRQLLDDFEREFADRLSSEPDVAAELQGVLGRSFLGLELPVQAETHLRRALELAERVPDDDTAVLTWRSNLAVALQGQGRHEEALAIETDLLATGERAGDPHLQVQAHGGLAAIYRQLAQSAPAEEHLQSALRILVECESQGPILSPRLLVDEPEPVRAVRAELLCELAALRLEREGSDDDLRETERILQQALALQRETLDPGHETITTTLNNLAETAGQLGNPAQAARLMQEVLQRDVAHFGESHATVAETRNNLAKWLMDAGDLAGAEREYRGALELLRATAGHEFAMARAANGLGSLLSRRQELEEAEALTREALVIRERLLGAHPLTATSLANLGAVLVGMRRDTEARTTMEKALAMRRELLGEVHPDVAHSLSGLSSLERRTGNPARAVELMRECLAIQRRLWPEPHPLIARSLVSLATSLETLGDLDEAEREATAAIEMLAKTLDAGHPAQSQPRVVLGKVLLARGDFDGAASRFEESLALLGAHYPDTHGETTEALEYLARALVNGDDGALARAEATLTRLEQAVIGRLPDDHRYAAIVRTVRAQCLVRRGRLQEAEQALRTALKARFDKAKPLIPAEARAWLGIVLVEQGRFAEAETELAAAAEVGGGARASPAWLHRAYDALARACDAQDRDVEAAHWRELSVELAGRR